MSVQLVYETHSLTLDNEDGVATGWLPGTLSPAGREQARLDEMPADTSVLATIVDGLATRTA